MCALEVVVSRVRESGVFQRNKVPAESKVLAAMLCFAGLSYRKASEMMGGSISYVSVRDAFIALRKAFPEPEKKSRRAVAVDETKTKLVGQQIFIWAARDVDSKEILAVRCSFARSILDSELFLKQVLQYCANKPLFLVDKGPWYPEAFKRLGLEYRHETS
ncbi:MAG: DDE-type integrase/transposase/recombinase [Thaumarchaeota archaeon]|nr:DDE-type integrase/transposase/recombinase [Nitrososphaerota archaeon]